jgi:hypothetical protein
MGRGEEVSEVELEERNLRRPVPPPLLLTPPSFSPLAVRRSCPLLLRIWPLPPSTSERECALTLVLSPLFLQPLCVLLQAFLEDEQVLVGLSVGGRVERSRSSDGHRGLKEEKGRCRWVCRGS